jgi:hypothetical protein
MIYIGEGLWDGWFAVRFMLMRDGFNMNFSGLSIHNLTG